MEAFSDNQVIKAIKNDDVKLFENLISKEGFDLNEIFKNTPIIAVDLNYIEICCYYGSMQCFMLLRSKFNCKITEKCLNYAFLNNNIKMINECLLDQKPGKDLMKYAIFSYNIDLVMFLINKYKMQIDPNDCISAHNIEAFIVQLEQTGDFDKYFQFTYRFNFLDLVKYFCPFVKDIDARDENGLSPIMHAIVYNKYELAELLVSNGSNVNGPFAEDSYILQMTVALGRFKFAELLVLNGANVNAVDKNGQYVVHYAAQANNKDIYKLLVSHGADLNVKDQNGRTAYDLAMGLGHKDLGKYLISLGFKKEEEEDRYHRAAKDMNGKNPLHVAVVKHDYKTVELLLKSGDIDINERDSYGLTAMFYALALGDMDIFKLLIRYGADVNMKYWY
ncbi:hypothetical protein TVAG_494870 [Trichomonas vaginalis G3]|uniref:DUF3447 domain-containing protein n=1 Tax=Trichomonas vaginalis (strain ATCC PRA-98 / G3) TaxID=412133 RepID=A2EXT4_TRIV3|nr:spectrin binding [Trichomonas vaginalis G3]EAY02538.1 hypothetical protein TVAG_494870 [Trichomonas vaginalis G3]KAI5506030.1 spectrin binding [Trichomonas vaginalis G3]|eukprot:XP_001314777.1 hypothetical protein [Trichomonas vaginalis G3]